MERPAHLHPARLGMSLGLLGPGLVLAACTPSGSEAPARAPSPDIVLVSIDSLRPDHLGCYGYPKPTSPTIDDLARRGVRCATAVSTTSWTLPAHVAMFTGLFDSTHGVVDNGLCLDEAARTLPEVLRDAGYRTAGFFGGPYLDPAFGFGQGFEEYRSCMSADPELSHRDVTGPRTVDAVTAWLDANLSPADPRPFFLFLHLWDVHYDYRPPPEHAERFDPGYKGRLDARDLKDNPAVSADMAPRDLEHLIALYDGEIRFTDDNLARILGAIDRHGRLANALLVVTADHGEEFFEHGGKGHQQSVFDEVVRIPWILCWPGHLPPGHVVEDQVRLVDLMPTLLSLAGVSERPPVQGRDVADLLRGGRMEPAPALLELLLDTNDVRGLRTRERKVVSWRHAREHRRYDLLRDPGERSPLPIDPELPDPALAELDRAVEAAAAFGATATVRKLRVEASLRRRLGRLGYTADDEGSPR